MAASKKQIATLANRVSEIATEFGYTGIAQEVKNSKTVQDVLTSLNFFAGCFLNNNTKAEAAKIEKFKGYVKFINFSASLI
jgi:hypothetical protein